MRKGFESWEPILPCIGRLYKIEPSSRVLDPLQPHMPLAAMVGSDGGVEVRGNLPYSEYRVVSELDDRLFTRRFRFAIL